MPGARCRKTEDRGQMPEDGRQMSEDGRQIIEGGSGNAASGLSEL